MKFGIEDNIIDEITQIFEGNPKVDKAFVFGSRAKGNYRPGSDIDIAIKGHDITIKDIIKMSGAFDDKNIPYKIDLIDYDSIKEKALVEHIDRIGIEFYSSWKEYKFSDFVEINPIVKLKTAGEYSFVEMKDLNDGERYCIPKIERTLTGGSKFENNDTLFARITPCLENGKISQVKGLKNGVGFGSTEFLVFRGKSKISDTDFVFYLSRWDEVRAYAENHFEGTSGRQRVPKNCFDDLILELPPLPEQTNIADVLSCLDNKIDLLNRQNKTLEELAEALFQQWFVENEEESWKKDTLGNVFDIGIGRTPPRKESQWFSTNINDIKWISIKDMGNCGIYIDSTAEYLTKEAVKNFNIPVIPENTVLLSFKMTLGRLTITTEKMLSNEAIAHFKLKENSLLYPEFLYLFLKTFRFETLGSTSSIVDAINSQLIKGIEIIIPDTTTLMDFKKLVVPYFQKIKSNSKQIKTLTNLRDTLLPKLMSGEVRVKM